jgi:hypothetical protein
VTIVPREGSAIAAEIAPVALIENTIIGSFASLARAKAAASITLRFLFKASLWVSVLKR